VLFRSDQKLDVTPDPTLENPNHANVTNWPSEKHVQKAIALEIAKYASFSPVPQDMPAQQSD